MFADIAKNIAQDLSNAFDRAKHEAKNTAPDFKSPIENEQVQKVIQSALGKCNIVTREEFDAQSAVLLRTREKLEALEQLVQSLENPAQADQPSTPTDKT